MYYFLLQSELYLSFKEVVSQSVIDVAAPEGITTQPEEHAPDFYNVSSID